MALAGLFIDDSAVAAYLYGLTAVTLLGRHEFDAAVAVFVVVPVDERCHPLTGLVLAGERLTRVIRSILHRPEQGFRVWVVVGHPWSGERPEHAQFLQPAFQCGCTHGVAVVGMEDQRLLPCLADPLSEASPAHQIRCNGGIFTVSRQVRRPVGDKNVGL